MSRDQEIVRLFDDGKSQAEIARAVGLTLGGVQQALRRLGLSLRAQREAVSIIVHTALVGNPYPTPRPAARVGHRRDGTAYAQIYTPDNKNWKAVHNAIGMQVRAAGVLREPTREPVQVALKFYTATRVRGDIDNLAKTVLDALTGVIWKDDKQITALYCEVHERDRQPRTEIFVRHAAGAQTALDA